MNTAGERVGQARIYALNNELTLNLWVERADAGEYAAYLHTAGDCSAADFTSAGGHLNPDAMQHGSLNRQGAHLGDLPNLKVSAGGIGTMSTRLPGSAAARLLQILDADGTALVMHARPDDYLTDPAGDAGSRIACGAFAPA